MSASPVHHSFLSFEHFHAMVSRVMQVFAFCLRVC
jgi:hypothetical protein